MVTPVFCETRLTSNFALLEQDKFTNAVSTIYLISFSIVYMTHVCTVYVLFQLFNTMLPYIKITYIKPKLKFSMRYSNATCESVCVVLIIQNLKIAVQKSRSLSTVVNAFLSLKSRNLLKFILEFPDGY